MASHVQSGEPKYLRECRRPAPNIDCDRENLVFMQVDTNAQDYGSIDKAAGIQLFGVTENGCSVLCHVWGFEHYFYVPAYDMDAKKFQDSLEKVLRTERRFVRGVKNLVTHCEEVYKRSIKYYVPGDPQVRFFKVRLAMPGLVMHAARVIRKGLVRIDGDSIGELQTFDSTLQYTLRFMIEKDVRGCSWIELQAGKYKRVHARD